MTDRPIFIVGAQRSGTTLMRLLLDAHPAICVGPETSFLKHVREGAARATGTDRSRKRQDTLAVDRRTIEAELAAAWGRILVANARAHGAARWGDKTPVHRYHGPRIRRLFPGAQVVAVVRHPAAVARSRARWGYEERVTVRDWASTVRHHRNDAQGFGPRRFRLVRYEDLLDDPRTTMADLLVFLNEPWDDAVLDHTAGVEEGTMTDGGTVMSDPLDPSRARAWTEDVDEAMFEVLVEEAAEEMALLGYAPDRDTPVLPLPDNELTERAGPPDPRGALRRAVQQRGAMGLVRRAVEEVRERGPGGAVRRWRRL